MKDKLKDVLTVLREEFPKVNFVFGFSLDFKKWFLFVSSFETYFSEDFKLANNIIREELGISYISVYLAKPEKNNEFKVLVF